MDIVALVKTITLYTLFYPIIMSIFWIVGSIIHNVKYKKVEKGKIDSLSEQKFIILTPIYNEESTIKNNLVENLNINYDNFEIWAIDDVSTDDSFNEINKINSDKLKIFKNETNLGKANTLNKYIDKLDSEYFIVVDSDTLIEKDSLKILNYNIQKDIEDAQKDEKENKIVAYTGNITVDSEYKNILLYCQKIEYRSFIDMIKRSQFVFTKTILTLSGAFSCYKTSAVKEIGYFNFENATEDINISWRFNQNGYKLKYLPEVKSSVSTPLNVYDLVLQRKRWTIGLIQTIGKNIKSLFSLKNNSLKFFTLEFILSSVWAFTLFFSSIYYIFNILTKLTENLKLFNFIYGIILVLIFSILLSLIAYKISNNNNESIGKFLKYYFWFPFLFYLIQPLGYVFGIKGVLFESEHGNWRNKKSPTAKYLFATIVDILITFISFRVILEIFEDGYRAFQNINILNLLVIFTVIKILFLILYYTKLKVGNRFVNTNYNLIYNVSFYLVIISLISNIYDLYLFSINKATLSTIFIVHPFDLLFYFLIIVILFALFKGQIKNSKDLHDYNENKINNTK